MTQTGGCTTRVEGEALAHLAAGWACWRVWSAHCLGCRRRQCIGNRKIGGACAFPCVEYSPTALSFMCRLQTNTVVWFAIFHPEPNRASYINRPPCKLVFYWNVSFRYSTNSRLIIPCYSACPALRPRPIVGVSSS